MGYFRVFVSAFVALAILVGCSGQERIVARKKVSPVIIETRDFRDDGTPCTCANNDGGSNVFAKWMRNPNSQPIIPRIWIRNSTRDDGAGSDSLWRPETFPQLDAGDERFLGCTREPAFPGDESTCRGHNEWSPTDPNISLISSDYLMFGSDRRFTDPVGSAVSSTQDGFVCEALCDINHRECPQRNLPDASFASLQTMLATVLGVSPENPVPVQVLADEARVDATTCERNEVVGADGRISNSSADGSSCLLEINSGISEVLFEFPGQFSSQVETLASSSVLDFTQSSSKIALSHDVSDSIFNGEIEYLKRSSDEFVAMIRNGSARYCLKLY